MAVDGYLKFNTKIDTSGFDSATSKISAKTKTTASEVSATAAETKAKIQAILDDTTRSHKSKAASIAAIYRKEGMEMSEAMKKAWDHIERGSAEACKKISKHTKGINASLVGLKSLLSKLAIAAGAALSVRSLINFGKQAIETASDVQEVQNVVDTAFGEMSNKMEDFADTAIETYGISKLTAKQTGSTLMAMAKGMGLANETASDMALTLTGLSADMASFYNKDQEETFTALKSVFTGETETLKTYGIVMTEANLQAYAYTQGINKKISAMSQAEKVQLRYNYVLQQTALAQGDFAKTSGSWANQTRILSEQWKEFSGTIGTIFMNVLLPAVQSLNKVMLQLNAVAQSALESLAAIFDWELDTNNSITSAITESVDAQNALTDATEATAKANEKTLASFDKVNKLNDNSAGSSSAISSGSVATAETMSVEVNTTSAEKKLTDFQQKIKEFVASFKLTFNDVFIDWENLNGEQIAEKIIAGLGAIVGAVAGFSLGGVPGAILGTILGVSLGLVISSLTFDHDGNLSGEEITKLIVESLTTIAGGIIGFVIGSASLQGAKGAAIGITLGAALGITLNKLTFNDDGNLSGEEITKLIIESLTTVAGGIIGFVMGGAVGAGIGIFIGAALGLSINELSFDNDGTLSGDEIAGLVVTALSAIAGGVIGFVVGGPGGAVVGASLGIGLSMLINKVDWEELWTNISTGFTEILTKIKNWLSKKKVELTESWNNFTSGVKDKTAQMKANIATKLNEFKAAWNQRAELVRNKTAQMKANIATKLNEFKAAWNQRAELVRNKTAQASIKFSQKVADIKNDAKARYDAITNAFSNIPNWFKNKFSEAWKKVKDVFSSGGKVFDGIKDGILNGLKSVINGLINGINKVIAKPFNGINTALKKIRDISIAGIQPFANKISLINVPQIPKLATGTVVPANYGEFLAILGDNKKETEVVSPLSTIKKALAEVMAAQGNGGDINITVELDGDVVYKSVVKKNKQNTKRTGVNALAY